MKSLRRPSAPMVMGVYAGFVAALAVLPVALLFVTWSRGNALQLAGERAVVIAQLRSREPEPDQRFLYEALQQVQGLVVIENGQTLVDQGPQSLAQDIRAPGLEDLCDRPGTYEFKSLGQGRHWAWSCAKSRNRTVYTAIDPSVVSTTFVAFLLFVLVLVVGLVTALVVLRVLQPLSRVSSALERVGAGERNVRLKPTGLAELDEIVYVVNDTAAAMEQREDAINMRIQLVQRLARMVAHEVRNPLQSMELLTSLLVSEEDPAERRATAQAVRREIQALDQVVDRMLRRSIGEDLDIQARPARLSTLISHVVRLHQPDAQAHGLKLVAQEVARDPVPVDRALVGRSLENLVVNALAYAKAEVRVGGSVNADDVELWVEDDGPGIDPEIADRVFEPNVSRRPGGTGLGLALVHAVAVAHGGEAYHERASLGGTRMVVRLPRHISTASGSLPRGVEPGAQP